MKTLKFLVKLLQCNVKKLQFPLKTPLIFFQTKGDHTSIDPKEFDFKILGEIFLGIKHFDADILVVNKCLLIRFD